MLKKIKLSYTKLKIPYTQCRITSMYSKYSIIGTVQTQFKTEMKKITVNAFDLKRAF